MSTHMNVIKQDLPLGAEIHGLDLRERLSGDAVDELRRVFHENGVVCIRGQTLTPEQQIAFGKYFGEPEEHFLTQFLLPGYPELLVVSNVLENGKHIGIVDAGSSWHTDVSYMKNPTYLSMLYALEVPHRDDGVSLGNTLFTRTAFAYETLADEIKTALAGKTSIHSYGSRSKARHESGSKREKPTQAQLERAKDVEHPIFRRHPYCDKTCIFVNKAYTTRIPGLEPEESSRYLNALLEHLTRPDFIYRHQWKVGDLIVWDNTQTQHIASFDYTEQQRRRMHRVSLRGTVPY